MPRFKAATILAIALMFSVVTGAVISGGSRPEEADGSLAQACAGTRIDHQLDNALFNVRAQSNGGSDPICEAIQSQVAMADQLRDDGWLAEKRPE
ncbi:MAG: hypothetical protein WCB10_04990 [Steroidobacteraceae bacterium]